MSRPLLVVGDVLLDRDVHGSVHRVMPDAPAPVLDESAVTERPGGAGLAAVLAAMDRPVRLVTALAADAGGRRLADLLAQRGIDTVAIAETAGQTREKTRLRASGAALARWDRGRPGALDVDPDDLERAAAGVGAVLVADYGGPVAAHPVVREWLDRLARRLPVVWDPHPRGAEPVAGCAAVTPNLTEATAFAGLPSARAESSDVASAGVAAAELTDRWACSAVVVTMGATGALVSYGSGAPLVVPAPPVSGGDTCGAGDRFAGTLAGGLADGLLPSEAAAAAVAAASAFVGAGGASGLDAMSLDLPGAMPGRGWQAAEEVARQVRARGGTLVATGGCFDLVHAGHVRALAAAARLGDALVVLVNDDASVRRLKGPQRPVQTLADRMTVLGALTCVSAVVGFAEDTPSRALERLRPDLWVKGGDYAGVELPEAAVLARWGGHVAVVPFLEGRSTTRMLDRLDPDRFARSTNDRS